MSQFSRGQAVELTGWTKRAVRLTVIRFVSMGRLSRESAWNALVRKDRRYDGRFVYGAVTTGIYCRPSCPARNPLRKNTRILWTVDEAEEKGYEPCRCCRPNALTSGERSIQAALNYIESHLDETPITLSVLSHQSGLSSHHLQLTFKRIVGISPKEFLNVRRICRFKESLCAGRSIAEACYEAGYGSSRALYESTRRALGMTPGAYQRGGAGTPIRYGVIPLPFGIALAASTKSGVCTVLVASDVGTLMCQLREEFPKAMLRRQVSRKWVAAASRCVAEDPLPGKLPLRIRERIFQARIWSSLSKLNSTVE